MKYLHTYEFDNCIFTKKGQAAVRKGEFISAKKLYKYTIPYEIQRFNKIIHDISFLRHKHMIMVSPPCIPYVKAYLAIRGLNGINIVNVRRAGRDKFISSLERKGFKIHT